MLKLITFLYAISSFTRNRMAFKSFFFSLCVCVYILVICVPYSLLPYIRDIFNFYIFPFASWFPNSHSKPWLSNSRFQITSIYVKFCPLSCLICQYETRVLYFYFCCAWFSLYTRAHSFYCWYTRVYPKVQDSTCKKKFAYLGC